MSTVQEARERARYLANRVTWLTTEQQAELAAVVLALADENERLHRDLNEKKGELAVAYGSGFSALDKQRVIADRAVAEAATLRQALERIAENAEAWHGVSRLAISQWARAALVSAATGDAA